MIRAFLICYATVLITSIKSKKAISTGTPYPLEGVCQRTRSLYAMDNIAYNSFLSIPT